MSQPHPHLRLSLFVISETFVTKVVFQRTTQKEVSRGQVRRMLKKFLL
jgi:hypothetical protein